MDPLISICIPAYKNATYLSRLLRSVEMQTFRDFEVVISDDSPDNEVGDLVRQYTNFPLIYQKNIPAKGSPANWNAAIKKASGKWIKIMHDDDWFANEHSLEKFSKVAQSNMEAGFIFSGFSSFEDGELKKVSIPGSYEAGKLKQPINLFSKNYIGHPSTTLIRNVFTEWYDERTQWVVDFEFYIRCLHKTSFHMIEEPLINIGISSEQITKGAFRNPAIEIPEYLYLLNKMGTGILKHMVVYDHYWRLFRNLNIRSVKEVEKFADGQLIPVEIMKMLKMQFKVPLTLLRIGVFSKSLMALTFYTN